MPRPLGALSGAMIDALQGERMKKPVRRCIWIDQDAWRRIKARAAQDDRTPASWVRQAIAAQLYETLPPTEPMR